MLDHTLGPYIVSFKSLTNVYNLRKYVFFYYRQVFGGMVAVWNNVTEEQWLFMKEISSDGDVSTVRMCELYIVYKKVLMLAHKPGRTIFCRCVYMYKCFWLRTLATCCPLHIIFVTMNLQVNSGFFSVDFFQFHSLSKASITSYCICYMYVQGSKFNHDLTYTCILCPAQTTNTCTGGCHLPCVTFLSLDSSTHSSAVAQTNSGVLH